MDTRQKTRRPARQRRPAAAGRGAAPRGTARPAAPKETPAVVYTQPDPFNRKRFILRLATVLAVVLAVVFGMSIFFKVDKEKITVAGTNKYTALDVREASGIDNKENLLILNKAAISDRILKKLPYIKSVRIGIELPDTVHIEVEEREVVYAIEAEDESWWLISADGLVVDKTTAAEATEHTRILGVQITAPQIASQAVAVEPTPEISENGETVPVTVYGRERLDAVISILTNMEKCGIIGGASTVDVSNMFKLEIMFGAECRVNLGDTSELQDKIQYLKDAIDLEEVHLKSGTLNVSDPDSVYFSGKSDQN